MELYVKIVNGFHLLTIFSKSSILDALLDSAGYASVASSFECTEKKRPFADIYRIGVLKNFAKFTGNTCSKVAFLIKLQASL